ncbi:MAG: DUF1131 family protein [Bacteroidota bacterium]
MRDLALLLALGLAGLAGCIDGGTSGSETQETLLALRPEGVGALDAETPFSAEAVGEALPDGFALEPGQLEIDSVTTLPVLYAFYEGQIVLEVYPDTTRGTIGRIDAASEAVTSPSGVRPGAGFAEAGGDDMDCEAGQAELSGRAVCTPSRSAAVRYVFAHGGAPVPGALPDEATLRHSVLERLVWTAR